MCASFFTHINIFEHFSSEIFLCFILAVKYPGMLYFNKVTVILIAEETIFVVVNAIFQIDEEKKTEISSQYF